MFPNTVIANTDMSAEHPNRKTDCFMIAELDIFHGQSYFEHLMEILRANID